MGKDWERRVRGQIEVLSRNLSGSTEEVHKNPVRDWNPVPPKYIPTALSLCHILQFHVFSRLHMYPGRARPGNAQNSDWKRVGKYLLAGLTKRYKNIMNTDFRAAKRKGGKGN
jgi:hypothetical protein